MYYFIYVVYLQFAGVGWTIVLIGALIMFLAGLLSCVCRSRVWSCVHCLDVCCYMLYVHYFFALCVYQCAGMRLLYESAMSILCRLLTTSAVDAVRLWIFPVN